MRVAGRIVHVHDGLAQLVDHSGIAPLRLSDAIPEGSLVQLTATWSPPGLLVDAAFSLVQPPLGAFHYASSEHAQTQRRARNLRERARIVREVRSFMDARGFLEVDTPLAVPSPGLDVHLDAMAVQCKAGERYLITSPEYQMKRLLSGGLERIYQVCKCFRNDELGERHQPEFTMLEWYRAFSTMDDVMRDTEELVAHIARSTTTTDDGRALLSTAFGPVDVTPPWRRITVREAMRTYAGRELDDVAGDEELFYRLMIEHVEPALEQLGAVFLCEYPAAMASLARKKPSDPSVAERFEAYVAGIELCNGFGELTDPVEQRARLEADRASRSQLGLPTYPLDERFLSALEQGMPPSGGNALGLDRLVMLALSAPHIEDVVAIGASRL